MTKNLLLASAAAISLSAAASADTYQATNWMAPSHILNEIAYAPFVKAIAEGTNGDVEFEVYSSGSLVPAPTTLQAVGDGVAQLGIVAASYTPSELPLSGMINDMAFTATDEFANAFALTEIAVTNPRLVQEYGDHNTIFLGGYSTPIYNFMCMKPVSDPASVEGLKVRTAGTAQNQWIASLGAIPVAVPMTDTYSGLERGSIDCTLSDPTNLEKGYKFWEVVKYINTLPQGASMGATYVLNKDFWSGLSTEDRRKILDLTGPALAAAQVAYHQGVESAMAGARERGIEITEADPAMAARLGEFQAKMIGGLAAETAKVRGIDDPSDIVAEYQKLVEKWHGLLADVDRNDAETVGKLVNDEIYAKLDAETFGLN
ncbi:C4-dicarboxylate TRAP transporter substrate-binding protein [Mangrovicoccus sp. HB161399]|uniref:C4-dicarboxylate TRAP transporter substrate-binding protein n=1 Tax=Mangrovicoccus sp. HB161399 TaxID=2720392 RepID=UPI0015573715|nr:C4-dicarboxylate TRAP transporter substrate-binding protein [Mangrovicoccus sp. HB161399]